MATIRLTPQRQTILDTIRHRCSHPTADEVYRLVREIMPRISLGTVYRNLEILSREGLLRKLDFGGGQKRFDSRCDPHYHVRCVHCHALADVEIPGEPVRDARVRADGFEIWGHHLEYYGLCASCRLRGAAESQHPSGLDARSQSD